MTAKYHPIRQLHRDAGITLIEVMVSILILSFALIGIAGMQAATMRYQLGSESRSAVSSLLSDISGRMRINLNEVPGYGTSTKYAFSSAWSAQHLTAPTEPAKLCGTESTAVPCTSGERADYDLYAWRLAARRAMPQGSVLLAGDINQGLTVTLMWYDKNFMDGNTLRTSATCTAAINALSAADFGQATLRRQTCCPDAASVSTTPGVRCANFTVIP